jgi:hypothetical protein
MPDLANDTIQFYILAHVRIRHREERLGIVLGPRARRGRLDGFAGKIG